MLTVSYFSGASQGWSRYFKYCGNGSGTSTFLKKYRGTALLCLVHRGQCRYCRLRPNKYRQKILLANCIFEFFIALSNLLILRKKIFSKFWSLRFLLGLNILPATLKKTLDRSRRGKGCIVFRNIFFRIGYLLMLPDQCPRRRNGAQPQYLEE